MNELQQAVLDCAKEWLRAAKVSRDVRLMANNVLNDPEKLVDYAFVAAPHDMDAMADSVRTEMNLANAVAELLRAEKEGKR